MPVDVLHDDDAVIHQHAQGQDEGEEDDHVEGDIPAGQENKRHEHGVGNGDGDENRRASADEDEDDGQNQDEARDNVVLEIGHQQLDILGHVRGQVDFQRRRQEGSHLVNSALDSLDHLEDVFAAALQHGEGNALLLVDPTSGERILVAILDEGQIAQVHRFSVLHEGDDGEDLRWVLEILGHTDQVFGWADVHTAARHVDVSAFNGGYQGGEGDIVCGDTIQVKLNVNLPFQPARDPCLQDSLHGLDAVLEIICEGLESAQAEGAGEDHPNDGDVGEVHLRDNGFVGKISGKVVLSLVDLIPHLLERIVDVHLGKEFDGNGGESFLRSGAHLLNVREPLELSLNRDRNQLLHVRGGYALIGSGNEDVRDSDIRE